MFRLLILQPFLAPLCLAVLGSNGSEARQHHHPTASSILLVLRDRLIKRGISENNLKKADSEEMNWRGRGGIPLATPPLAPSLNVA